MNISEWISYGKNLAVTHADILHQDVTGKRAFEVVDVEDAFGDVRSAGKVMLRWLIPTYLVEDPGGNGMKVYSAGFLVLCWHGRGRTEDFLTALDSSEQIADEIIARIRTDAEADPTLFVGGMDSYDDMVVSGVPLKGAGDSTYSGWLVTMRYYGQLDQCANPAKWTDL